MGPVELSGGRQDTTARGGESGSLAPHLLVALQYFTRVHELSAKRRRSLISKWIWTMKKKKRRSVKEAKGLKN